MFFFLRAARWPHSIFHHHRDNLSLTSLSEYGLFFLTMYQCQWWLLHGMQRWRCCLYGEKENKDRVSKAYFGHTSEWILNCVPDLLKALQKQEGTAPSPRLYSQGPGSWRVTPSGGNAFVPWSWSCILWGKPHMCSLYLYHLWMDETILC